MSIPNFWQRGDLGHGRAEAGVIFGQVREDNAPEMLGLMHWQAQHTKAPRVFSIASGGCTVLNLLANGAESVLACDINPAQIALVELKRAVLEQLEPKAIRMAFLVDGRAALAQVQDQLPEHHRHFWSTRIETLRSGLNRCGEIDRRLERAIKLFYAFVHSRATVRRMLNFNHLDSQVAFYRSTWQNPIWNAIWAVALNRFVLRSVYGRTIIERLPSDFAIELQQQVQAAFTSSISAENPALWSTLMPSEPAPDQARAPMYLQEQALNTLRQNVMKLKCEVGDAVDVISRQSTSFDIVTLSNILDVMPDAFAERLTSSLEHRLNPGALVLLRFFFKPTQALLNAFTNRLTHLETLSEACRKADRGLFCRYVYVFEKQ